MIRVFKIVMIIIILIITYLARSSRYFMEIAIIPTTTKIRNMHIHTWKRYGIKCYFNILIHFWRLWDCKIILGILYIYFSWIPLQVRNPYKQSECFRQNEQIWLNFCDGFINEGGVAVHVRQGKVNHFSPLQC